RLTVSPRSPRGNPATIAGVEAPRTASYIDTRAATPSAPTARPFGASHPSRRRRGARRSTVVAADRGAEGNREAADRSLAGPAPVVRGPATRLSRSGW